MSTRQRGKGRGRVLSAKNFQIGNVMGTIYDFPEIGDELAMHEHDEATNHITIIARGSFELLGSGQEASAGAVLDWPAHERHGARAKEPNSRLVNIRK